MTRQQGMRLSDAIAVSVDYQRSVSVDNPGSVSRVAMGYIPTERSLDMLSRMARVAGRCPAVRAWSVTGPYGSGKSSFLALASVLFGDLRASSSLAVFSRFEQAVPHLATEMKRARDAAGVSERGYILAITAASTEPVRLAVARALRNGADQYWAGRGRKPAVLHKIRRLSEEHDPGAADLVQAFSELEEYAPVLLAIDEFGKTLEYASENHLEGDLYVMQLLAEHVNSSTSSASCLLTLQHLAISDYVGSAYPALRKEWTKVQGRFQEVAFAASPDQAVAFMRGHLHREPCRQLDSRIPAWVTVARESGGALGSSLLQSILSEPESTYPLHPLAVAIAPALSQRFSQSDRSIHAWLAGGEPSSVSHYLEVTTGDVEPLPVYGPDLLFDYFLGSAESRAQVVSNDSRVIEVLDRVAESRDRDALQVFLMKTTGLLNLVGPMVAISSSRAVLTFAAQVQGFREEAVSDALRALEGDGFLLHRDHANEYRIWQGSDVDIATMLGLSRQSLVGLDVLDELNRISPAEARVAQRHGHATGTFRYFRTVYGSASPESRTLQDAVGDADGLMVLSFDDAAADTAPLTELPDGRPVIVCLSPDRNKIERLLVESVSLALVAVEDSVRADPVARREVRERQAEASAELAFAINRAFDPDREDLHWFAAGQEVRVDGARALSGLLSDVCDRVYSKAVTVHNEILNRVQLTSQGAKARRELLAHMLESPSSQFMGIEGFGPERSMYASFFSRLGLHGQDAGGAWSLQGPLPGSSIEGVWSELDSFAGSTVAARKSLDEVYARLKLPPFGVREPLLPLLVLTYLAIHSDEVALYQDGTFEPELTVPLMERLIKAPDRFALRKIGGGGLRELAARRLAERLGGSSQVAAGTRNGTLIQAVRPLFAVVRRLSEYSLYTSQVSEPARKARTAITSATELDELLFVELPKAIGVQQLGVDDVGDEHIAVLFADSVGEILDELAGAYEALLSDLEAALASRFNVRPGAVIRTNLRERARRLQGHVIDQRLRAFVAYALDENLSDRAWLQATCMGLADKSPSTWRDADREVFDARLRELAGLFMRVEHLCSAVDSQADAQGFIARRIAVTHPDGMEASRVVWANMDHLPWLQGELAELRRRLEATGERGMLEAFLSLLADDVLGANDAREEHGSSDGGVQSAGRKRA
ncbi:MAG: hypothetical protein ACYC7C_05100 [Coriobacteriia bacterium]